MTYLKDEASVSSLAGPVTIITVSIFSIEITEIILHRLLRTQNSVHALTFSFSFSPE